MNSGVGIATGLQGARLDSGEIPLIDMSPLIAGTDKLSVAREIGRACHEVGFFYIVGHGLEAGLIESAFAQARRFFDLPAAAKEAVHIARSPQHRGYFPLFEENTDPERTADLKEGFDLARDLGPQDPQVLAGLPLHGPNHWPAGLPGFQEALMAYFDRLCGLSHMLLEGFALSLDLAEDFFSDKIDRPLAQLRLLRYPPQQGYIEEDTLGCGAHSDYGCLTILAQDDVAGLQIRTRDGRWIEAPPIPGSFVINTGDQMARWTNGRYPATLHRVINQSGCVRHSRPFFFDPNYEAEIACLESCLEPGQIPRHTPVIAGEYLASRYNDTFNYRQD